MQPHEGLERHRLVVLTRPASVGEHEHREQRDAHGVDVEQPRHDYARLKRHKYKKKAQCWKGILDSSSAGDDESGDHDELQATDEEHAKLAVISRTNGN